MKLKVVIQSLDDKKGYLITCEDGREYIAKDISGAISLKEKIQDGKI